MPRKSLYGQSGVQVRKTLSKCKADKGSKYGERWHGTSACKIWRQSVEQSLYILVRFLWIRIQGLDLMIMHTVADMEKKVELCEKLLFYDERLLKRLKSNKIKER